MKRKGARAMFDIATGLFTSHPSVVLLPKIREYYTMAQNEKNQNNNNNQEPKAGENDDEDLDITTNTKPAEDELPKYEEIIEKLLNGMPDSDFKLEAMVSEKYVQLSSIKWYHFCID